MADNAASDAELERCAADGDYPAMVELQRRESGAANAQRKVVINACFGGFGLSHEAILAYAERKGMKLYVKEGRFSALVPYSYYTVPPEQYEKCSEEWFAADGDYKRINATGWYFSERDIDRDDPDLVAVVEEMGEAASDKLAKLEVVEIPADVDWKIEEYDGYEHVAEVHRTWP